MRRGAGPLGMRNKKKGAVRLDKVVGSRAAAPAGKRGRARLDEDALREFVLDISLKNIQDLVNLFLKLEDLGNISIFPILGCWIRVQLSRLSHTKSINLP